MPQEPKKRHSRARQGKRRASIHLHEFSHVVCANCSANIIPHRVCKNCGFYRGKQVVAQKAQPTAK